MILAIDPGKSGGLAWGTSAEFLALANMPDTAHDLVTLVKSINPDKIVCEEVGGYAGGAGAPGSAMFNFGFGCGIIHGVAAALGIPLELCRPQKWQKALSLGNRGELTKTQWKNKLKTRAQQLYPSHAVTLAVADAILIFHASSKNII